MNVWNNYVAQHAVINDNMHVWFFETLCIILQCRNTVFAINLAKHLAQTNVLYSTAKHYYSIHIQKISRIIQRKLWTAV